MANFIFTKHDKKNVINFRKKIKTIFSKHKNYTVSNCIKELRFSLFGFRILNPENYTIHLINITIVIFYILLLKVNIQIRYLQNRILINKNIFRIPESQDCRWLHYKYSFVIQYNNIQNIICQIK